MEIGDIAEAIGKYQPGNNRSQIKTTQNNTLVCDSYNANPTSMMAAVKSFFELKTCRKVLILGDMLELGEKSEEEHLKLIESIRPLKPETVLLGWNNFSEGFEGF